MSYRRTLKELNLIDSFLFNEMLNHESGDWFASMLIERIMGKLPGKVHVIGERIVQGTDSDKHGIQIDAYIEEVNQDVEIPLVYDIEPNNYYMSESKLARRTRYYQSITDAKLLSKGLDYEKLNDSITIFILPYDPFGEGALKYTFKRGCIEYPKLPYDDGQTVIYLYTKGKHDNTVYGKKLSDMLQYFENSNENTAGQDDDLTRTQQIIDNIRQSAEIGGKYMRMQEIMYLERQEARREGLEEGREEGRKKGIEEGRKEGRKEGREEGQNRLLEEMVIKKLAKGIPERDLPDLLEQEPDTIKRILDKIKEEKESLV